MKLKSYILVGYIISTLLTIIVVFWAIQRMLIEESEIYFLVGMTLMASFVGAGISQKIVFRIVSVNSRASSIIFL